MLCNLVIKNKNVYIKTGLNLVLITLPKKPYIIGMNVINPILTVLHTFQIVVGLAKGDLFKKYEAKSVRPCTQVSNYF